MTHALVITCRCCGKTGYHRGSGYRETCHRRWVAAGRPDTGPPPPRAPREIVRLAVQGRGQRAGRVEDYAILRRERGLSLAEAAAALGVSIRTAQRYDADLKAGAR
jgi:hypothetical protein